MKLKITTWALVVVALLACITGALAQETAPEPEDRVITLDEALTLAFENNPGLQAAADRLNRSRAGVAEARARFRPQFNAEATYLRQGPQTRVTIPDVGEVDLVTSSNATLSGSVLLPLDLSNRLSYLLDIARLQFQIDYLDLLSTSETLILDVKQAYYNVLRAQGRLDVAQAAVNVAQERLENTLARFEAGVVPRFDVTTAETDLANLNQQLIAARNAVRIARAALNRVIGIEILTPTRVVEVDVPVDIVEVDDELYVELATNNRPTVRIARGAVEIARRSVKVERAALRPSLGLSGTYNYNVETSGFNASNQSWVAALSLSVPIWDGGVTAARVDQAQADVQIAQDNLEQARLGVALDARVAALNVEEAAERVSTAAQAVELAEEALRLANVRYEAGISPFIEVTDAEARLTEARNNLVNARYDYATAVAQLMRAASVQPELDRLRLLDITPVIEPESEPETEPVTEQLQEDLN